MHHRSAVVWVAVIAGAALAWGADEAKVYEISWRDDWKVGQVATVTDHETSDFDMTMNGKSLKAEHELLDATYVLRCDELDANGAPAKWTAFMTSWKKTRDQQTDESLAGLRITVAGKVWTLPEGTTPGPLAKKWLDKRFTHDDDPLSRLAPPKMAVGQTWKPDPKTAAEAFAKSLDDAPIDLARVAIEVKLVSVEGTPPDASGTFEVKATLPLKKDVPGMPPSAIVLPDSGAEVVGRRTAPLARSTMLGTMHMEATLTMNVAAVQQGQKLDIATNGKLVQDRKTVAGGEIPAAAAKAPSPPPDGK